MAYIARWIAIRDVPVVSAAADEQNDQDDAGIFGQQWR